MSCISRCLPFYRILINRDSVISGRTFPVKINKMRKIDRIFKNTLVFLEKLYYNMNHIKQAFW